MVEVIIENLVEIVATLIITLIGALGAWLTTKLAKRAELDSINSAQQELITMAQITVGELQQTMVEELKAAHEDKKLTEEEIAGLGKLLIQKTMEKMSAPAQGLLNAAGVDIIALIQGTGEDWINRLKE